MSYRPPSIEDEGIDHYLNRTREDHNGLGYRVFATLVDAGVSVPNLRKAMNVKTRDTIIKYMKLYKDHKARQKTKRKEHDEAVEKLRDL